MNGRAIAFILLSSLIMMAAMTMQNLFNPQAQPVENAPGQIAQEKAGGEEKPDLSEPKFADEVAGQEDSLADTAAEPGDPAR